MFRQYQSQESSGSQSAIRTVSGVSQSFETTAGVNGRATEETSLSAVTELATDSESSSTVISRPPEGTDELKPASITVSNILTRTEEDEEGEQKSVQDSSEDVSGDGSGTAATEATEEDNLQMPKSSLAATNGRDRLETGQDSVTTCEEDQKEAVIDDGKLAQDEASSSMTEDSLNETETEVPVVSEQADQSASESAASLENSIVGGASVVNEDLVDVSSVSDQVQPSDADDSQEEPSDVSATSMQEADLEAKEDGHHGEDEDDKTVEGEKKDEKQETELDETVKENETKEKQVPAPSGETESTKEVQHEPSSSTDPPTADQQPSEATPPPSGQEVVSVSATTSTKEETSAESSSIASSSGTQNVSADSVSKTKEIKIARLDVSNVALDTERLELRETSAAVCKPFIALCGDKFHI